MASSKCLITEAIQALQILPGIGPKSAQRIFFHLMQHDPQRGQQMTAVLNEAFARITHCKRCRNFCEGQLCQICQKPNRDEVKLCVVENPSDVVAIEQTHAYRGYYFVLMGRLSPLDGMGPEQIGIPKLLQRLKDEPIQEVILATNPTVEGEATAYFIAEQCQLLNIECSRLASGIPMGGDLEFLDGRTIERALDSRRILSTKHCESL
jgi:recombination protein RecR